MLVYGLVFGVFIINAFMNDKSTKHMNLVVYVFFILLFSLRNSIGTDWVAYKDYFDNFSTSVIEVYKFEIGYELLNSVTHWLFTSFWTLVFVVGIFNGVLFWKATSKHTKNIGIVMLLSLYYIFYPSLEAFRQSICLILFYYSLEYIEKDEKKYLLINLIGLLFHRSVLIALIFYAFNKNNKLRILIVTVAIFFKEFETVFSKIFKFFPTLNIKYEYYFNNTTNISSIFTLKLLEYSLMLLLYFYLYKKKSLDNHEKVVFNLVFLGFSLQIALTQISDIIYRMTYYTDIGMMLCYVFIYDRIKGSLFKYFYIVFLIIYVFLRLYRIFPFYDPRFMY